MANRCERCISNICHCEEPLGRRGNLKKRDYHAHCRVLVMGIKVGKVLLELR